MSNTLLYIIWAVLYLGCGALGIFNAPDWAGILGCICFFIPPALLLQKKDRKTTRILRNLALIWLGTTLVLLILNILSVAMSETAGNVLYYTMAVVSSPMVCGRYWLIALFLWSYVLMASLKLLRK